MKTCCTCKKDLPIDSFSFKNIKNNIRSSECKSCHSEYNKEWYGNHRQERIDYASLRRDLVVDYFKKYKDGLKCKVCGENHPATLDFHHREQDKKEYTVSQMIRQGYAWESVLKEIEKCDVLCSNCHRKLHSNIVQ